MHDLLVFENENVSIGIQSINCSDIRRWKIFNSCKWGNRWKIVFYCSISAKSTNTICQTVNDEERDRSNERVRRNADWKVFDLGYTFE